MNGSKTNAIVHLLIRSNGFRSKSIADLIYMIEAHESICKARDNLRPLVYQILRSHHQDMPTCSEAIVNEAIY